jgi:mannitol-1-phosphate/altronate dehydrogenase
MDQGRPHGAVLMAAALWICSCTTKNENGEPIIINDPAFNQLPVVDQQALPTEQVVEHFLKFDHVFSAEWRTRSGLTEALAAACHAIKTHGALRAIEDIA